MIMRQLHIVQSIQTDFGGLGLAALRYSESIAEAGANVVLFAARRSGEEIAHGDGCGRFSVVGVRSVLSRFGSKNGFVSQVLALRKIILNGDFDILHVHGVWSPILAVAVFLAKFKGVPVIVSPHGSLEPWALEYRRLKKRLAMLAYQGRVLRGASMLVATAGQELESIRKLGLCNPVAVLPNGVDSYLGTPAKCSSQVRKILFLSRIHPKKGIRDLILAWAKVRQDGWRIIIAGPDENGHAAELQSLISSLGLSDDFEFPGLVVDEAKERCFAEASIFVLPTYSENFGIAVAEALARGVPVITTTGAPWEDVLLHDCGWWVQPGVGGISQALSAAISTPSSILIEMGGRGKALVEEKYSWSRIGKSALLASEWVVYREESPPSFVDTD